MTTTVSPDEISKFEQMAADWWDPLGKFKPLHDLNPIRLKYIIDIVQQHYQIDHFDQSLSILDIGCGGGLISEPLARLDANITAIDASEININIAKLHAERSELKIHYQQILAEELAQTKKQFKVILALEIIEHIENIEYFIENCCKLVQPGGLMIFSTINQTVKSFFQAIIGAEYILKWLPIGTHNWSKFVKPSVIARHAQRHKMQLHNLQGITYSLFTKEWSLTQDISNNYFIAFTKSKC